MPNAVRRTAVGAEIIRIYTSARSMQLIECMAHNCFKLFNMDSPRLHGAILFLIATLASAVGCGTDGSLPSSASDQEGLEWSPHRGRWDDRMTIAGFTDTDTRLPAFASSPMVADFARDKNGDVLAVGQFSWSGRKPIDPFVRLHDGQWKSARKDFDIDAAWGISAVGVGPKGEIALSVNLPPKIGHRQESRIWVDRGHGFEAVTDVQGAVRTLVWAGDKLWMAGFFQMTSGVSHLAVWDGTTWSAPPGGPANQAVYDVMVDDRTGHVLVGGAFTEIGGIAAKKVAEWNGTAWTPHDMDFGAWVYALARGPEGQLYAGGYIFEELGRGIGGGVARWNGTAWEMMGGGVFAGNYGGVVSDVAVHQGSLYITGCFNNVRNPAGIVLTNGIARWSGSEWEPLAGDALGGANGVWGGLLRCGFEGPAALWQMPNQRLFSMGTRLLVGGYSGGQGGVASQSIIAYDGEGWQAQGKANQGFAGPVSDLVIGGPKQSLYAFGGISHVAGRRLPLLSVARRDENQWTILSGSLPERTHCSRIAVDRRGDVFAACSAGIEIGATVNRLFKLTGSEWVALADMNEKVAVAPNLVADPEGRLWMVGGARDSGYVARWDGDHFTMIERGFDGPVAQIDFARSCEVGAERAFVVGGDFTHIGTAEISRVARFDGRSFAPLGAGLPSAVYALEYGERFIYASSNTSVPGSPVLAQWNGTEWIDIGTPERGLPAPMERTRHQFRSLVEYRGKLIAAGEVWPTSGGRNVFVYDGTRFTSLGGGVAGAVSTIAVADDGLWFGGEIAEAGAGNERIPSTGIAHWKN
ncbi:hypothetical protein [Pendulispora albinea]|uniref:Uncharacterized protein n=1 Tax=Pendulispora albinea TaxID=2741071 RepID=A0ABZ2LVZ4_9BACT